MNSPSDLISKLFLISSNNGHMVKFELFESTNNYQCHFKNLGTYVVSIAHFMRAYFNQQALVKGNEFELPGDAGYLNVSLLFILFNSCVFI